MEIIENEKGTFIAISDEDITFYGDTEQEKELNKQLYHTTLELNRFQDGNRELRDMLFELSDEGIDTIGVQDVLDHLEI